MELIPNKINLKDLFASEDVVYRVPSYQRDYSWKPENVIQLWEDIINSWESKNEYFMGAFVLNTENCDGDDKFDIVDGQQRLATFSILFVLLKQYSEKYLTAPTTPIFANIGDQNIIAARSVANIAGRRLGWEHSGWNYYLSLNVKDSAFYRDNIINRGVPPLQEDEFIYKAATRRLDKTYLIFSKFLVSKFLNKNNAFVEIKDFLNHTITKLWFLRLQVSTSQDAYLLFEGLNHKGLGLSVADLLKNKFLMLCGSEEESKKRVLEMWGEMDDNIKDSRFDLAEYIRVYWVAFYSSSVTKKQLYGEISKKTNLGNVENVIKGLKDMSEFFGQITNRSNTFPSTNYVSNSIEQTYAEINTLKYSVCYPLFLKIKKLRPSILDVVVNKSLAYLFRMISIMEYSVGRAKSAVSDAMEIISTSVDANDVLSKFDMSDGSDDKFIAKLKSKSFDSNYLAKYFLVKIHTHNEGSELVVHSSSVHLEHILPVKFKNFWHDFIPLDGTEVEDWVLKIGNMTLLDQSLNQRIQNKGFNDKVLFYKKRPGTENEGSSIQMTIDIFEKFNMNTSEFKWNVSVINERSENLAEKAIEIW